MMVESLVTSLREMNLNFDKKHHMSYMAHIINLIVQKGLRCMEIPKVFTIERMVDLVDDDKLLMFPNTSTSMGEIMYQVKQLVAIICLFTQR